MISPETMGTMGSTQGVNDKPMPATRKDRITQTMLLSRMTATKRSCSETKGRPPAAAAGLKSLLGTVPPPLPAPEVPFGNATFTVLTIGG